MKINELVQGLANPKLREAAIRLGNTPEGKKLLNSLTSEDRELLMRRLGGMEVNGIQGEMLLRKINEDPDLLQKLNQLVSKKR